MLPVRSFVGINSTERALSARSSQGAASRSTVQAASGRSPCVVCQPAAGRDHHHRHAHRQRVPLRLSARRAVAVLTHAAAESDDADDSAEAAEASEAAEAALRAVVKAVEAGEGMDEAVGNAVVREAVEGAAATTIELPTEAAEVIPPTAPVSAPAAAEAVTAPAVPPAKAVVVVDDDDQKEAQVAELNSTVRALKLRMASLAKLLDEAVARRQKLEEQLASEKEASRNLAVETRQKIDGLTAQVDQYKSDLEQAKVEGQIAAKELAESAARLEKKLEARLKAAVSGAGDATAEAKRREAEAAAARATQILARATEMERTARGALEADQAAAARSAIAKSEKELEAAIEARDAARACAAAAEAQLQNQNALLIRVDQLVAENGETKQAVEAKEEAIQALNKEVETLRVKAAAAAAEAAESTAAAEAVEEKIADRVAQTLQAAETCVSTAEKVKQEVERNAAAAAALAETQIVAAVARAQAAEANLARSNESLERMTEIATQKEAVDLKVAMLQQDVAAKAAEIEKLTTEGRASAEAAAMWEGKATSAAALLEKRAREVAEARENIELRSMQIAAAIARAERAEANLRRQTELLDEMAEVAALKEAADAAVVEMQQEQIASAREIERLTAEARAGAEAATMWEAKAMAANATVQARARAAEEAARAREEAAAKKMAVLEETSASVVARVDEEAVARAINSRLAAINADADYRVSVAARNSEALRRALSASTYSVEVWRERAELAAADLAHLTAAMEADARAEARDYNDDDDDALTPPPGQHHHPRRVVNNRVGGRIAAAAFSSGADLRAFVSSGPRIVSTTSSSSVVGTHDGDVVEDTHRHSQVRELDAVGLGAPVHGRYDRLDKFADSDPRSKNNNAAAAPGGGGWGARQQQQRQQADEVKRRPVMKWDVGEEHRMKERLPFNPRAVGKVGRAPTVDADEDSEEYSH